MSEEESVNKLSSEAAEQLVLGYLLLNEREFDHIRQFISENDFYWPMHSKIFSTIERLVIAGQAVIDIDTYLQIENMDSKRYVSQITAQAIAVADISIYVKKIKDLALKRSFAMHAQGWLKELYTSSATATEQINDAEYKLFNITADADGDIKNFSDTIGEVMADIDHAMNNPGHVIGISSKLKDLDNLLAGFQKSDLLILAGRPSMGKTAFAINLALNACRDGNNVCFFSLEMSAVQLALRMLAINSSIDISHLKRGMVKEEQYNMLRTSANSLGDIGMFIDDTPAISIASIRSKARKLKKQHGISMIVVDYLQLVRPSLSHDSRVLEISEITQGLKAIAKELDMPVIALSQLSRAVEQRADKRPMLSDLRESGTIEQDSDIVMFIYREEYYLSREVTAIQDEQLKSTQMNKLNKAMNTAEIIVAKHRNGPIGNVILHYIANIGKFDNHERDLG